MIKYSLIIVGMVLMFCASGLAESLPEETRKTDQQDIFCGAPHMMFAQMDLGMNHPGERPYGKGRRMAGVPGAKHRKHVEQLRMLKMLELLDLSGDQEATFLVAFNRLRRSLQQTDDRCIQQLDSLAEGLRVGSLPDAEIYRFSTAIYQTKAERVTVIGKFQEDARKILSPEQYGKLVVFHERFDLAILQQLRAFRGSHGPGGGFNSEEPEPENP